MKTTNNIRMNYDHLTIIIILVILAIAGTWRIKIDRDEQKIKEIRIEQVKTFKA